MRARWPQHENLSEIHAKGKTGPNALGADIHPSKAKRKRKTGQKPRKISKIIRIASETSQPQVAAHRCTFSSENSKTT